MKSTRIHFALRRWLRHEAAGRERRAEAALASVFALLPRDEPSAAFVANVLGAAGFAVSRVARDLRGFRLRALVAASGLLVATALAFVPSLLVALDALVRSGKPLELVAEALAAGIGRVAGALSVWEAVARVAGIAGSLLSSPTILTILALCAAVSLVAFRLLEGFLKPERSITYAEL